MTVLDQLARIRGLVGSGKAQSGSGFVQHAVSVSLDDVAGWGAMLAAALELGRLLATSGTADIADAHVVICARRCGQQVMTSDPDDLGRLDAHVGIVTV